MQWRIDFGVFGYRKWRHQSAGARLVCRFRRRQLPPPTSCSSRRGRRPLGCRRCRYRYGWDERAEGHRRSVSRSNGEHYLSVTRIQTRTQFSVESYHERTQRQRTVVSYNTHCPMKAATIAKPIQIEYIAPLDDQRTNYNAVPVSTGSRRCGELIASTADNAEMSAERYGVEPQLTEGRSRVGHRSRSGDYSPRMADAFDASSLRHSPLSIWRTRTR